VRFTALGYLGAHFGKHIMRLLTQYGLRALYVGGPAICNAAIVMLIRRSAVKSQAQIAGGFGSQT
jgi:hypothetical protein